METFPLSFTALRGFQNLPAAGNLFVYESAVVADGAETRVRIKPDSGGEVWLKPGQWFRTQERVSNWSIKSFNSNDIIDAFFVIGDGDFGDANTLNKFKLDATFANTVLVTNTVGQALPVAVQGTVPVSIQGTVPVSIQNAQVEITNDSGNRIAVSLDPAQVLNTVGNTVAYTSSYSNTAGTALVTLVTPAANVNGVLVSQSIFRVDTVNQAILAKTTPPANPFDGGDLLAFIPGGTAGTFVKDQMQYRVPAGKGVYIVCDSAIAGLKSVLYTVL